MSELDIKKGPEIGMGATISVGSDSYAYTIVDVSNKLVKFEVAVPGTEKYNRDTKRYESETMEVRWPEWIEVTQDKTKLTSGSGQDGSAEYEYEPQVMKRGQKFILKAGRYRAATKVFNEETRQYEETNRTSIKNQTIGIGFRREYRDPSF